MLLSGDRNVTSKSREIVGNTSPSIDLLGYEKK